MSAAEASPIYDVDEDDFDELVTERSRLVPVVVDFWAEWCAPCRALGPALERAVAARGGRVSLAKVSVDYSEDLAARYRIQGIPAVKAFRDGEVAAEFTGAMPPAELERFLDGLVPSQAEEVAERAVAEGDEQGLRAALELDPRQRTAAVALARLLLRRGEEREALEVTDPLATDDFVATGLAARARLELSGEPQRGAFEALDGGDHERALELLQAEVASADAERREELRKVMVAVFTELGPESALARTHRRRPGCGPRLMLRRLAPAIVAAAICAALIGGCGGDDDDAGAAGNATGRAFAASMVPHHEGAVDMGRLAERKAGHAGLKSLAKDIVSSQTAEIRTLRRIERELQSEGIESGSLGLDEDMMGMYMDMHQLESASPFDRAFIDMMVPHHLGAVRMSRVELRRGESAELRALARDVIDAQTREIRRMRRWRKAWCGSGATPSTRRVRRRAHDGTLSPPAPGEYPPIV